MELVKVTSDKEVMVLKQRAEEILHLVSSARNMFGYDCFTEKVVQKINTIDKLDDLIGFGFDYNDLNEQLSELETEDPKMYTRICRFIKAKLGK